MRYCLKVRHVAPSVDLLSAAGVQRAVRRFGRDRNETRLAYELRLAVPGLVADPLGDLTAREVARLVRQRWQEISNRRDLYRALLEGRAQRTDMPFDVKLVSRAALSWLDNLVDDRAADDAPRQDPTAAEVAVAYGVSRATAYRLLRTNDLEQMLAIYGRAIRRKTVKALVARGRSVAAARRLLDRRPELIGQASRLPPPHRHRKIAGKPAAPSSGMD